MENRDFENISNSFDFDYSDENQFEEYINMTDEEENFSYKKNSSKKEKTTKSNYMETLVKEYYSNSAYNEKIYRKLYERFYYGLRKYAYGMIKDYDAAADMVSETFENALNNRERYDITKGQYSTWLYRICRNCCLGYLYRKNKASHIDNDISNCFDSLLSDSSSCIEEDSSDSFINANEGIKSLSKDECMQMMYKVTIYEIEHFNERTKKVLKDKLVYEKKFKEMSIEYNMHESTIKNILYKGKEELEHILRSKYKDLYDIYTSFVEK